VTLNGKKPALQEAMKASLTQMSERRRHPPTTNSST
jgi:hypothetical protein